MSKPISNLFEILELVKTHGPPTLSTEFERAVNCYLNGHGSLDFALGLDGNARHDFLRARRDKALYKAFMLIEGSSEWNRCESLAAEIKSFESRVWPRTRNLKEISNELTVRHYLHQAFSTRTTIPRSTVQLLAITKKL